MVLVDPQQVQQLPERKPDVKDAQWLAESQQRGLLRASFMPLAAICALRK